MQLSLEQAAARLGKTERQVRYMIKMKRLRAQKLAGRWIIESDDLPLSQGQIQAAERKERQLRAAVEEGLGLPENSQRKPRYALRDMKAFQLALPIQRQALEHLGEEHPATIALREVLEHLAIGCHRFAYSTKAEAYHQARDHASLAVCELVLHGSEEADEIITGIEQ